MTKASAILLIAVLAQGCSTFGIQSMNSIEGTPVARTGPSYVVTMNPNTSKATKYEGRITSPITVQDALEASGALKKFRNMEIDVVRTVPETGKQIRLASDFDPAKKRVKVEQDYAIHPNDKIVVKPMEYSAFDKMLRTTFRMGN